MPSLVISTRYRGGEFGANRVGRFEVARGAGGFHGFDLFLDVGVGELAGLDRFAQLVADVFFASLARSPNRRPASSSAHRRRRARQKFRRTSSTPPAAAATSSFLISPASNAAFAWRTISKIAACAWAVFRSSSSAARMRSTVSRGQRLHLRDCAVRKIACAQAQAEISQPLDRNCRLLESVEGEVQLIAIRNRGQQIADRRRLVSLQHQIAQGEEVSQALRHLLAFDQQKAGMKPEMRERLCR